MKIYTYHRLGNKDVTFEMPIPYAHTTSKKMAAKFEAVREMKYFHKQVVDVPKGSVDLNSYMHGNLLKIGTFETRNELNNDMRKRIDVDIVCTWDEEIFVFKRIDEIFYEIGKIAFNHMGYVSMMNDSYRDGFFDKKIYDYLSNFYCRRFVYEQAAYGGILPCEQLMAGNDDLDWMKDGKGKEMKIDQLGVFLHFFGDTMKNDLKIEENILL